METEKEQPKILILYNNLFHYRIPIFNLLAEKCSLTVAYSIGPDTKETLNFNVIKLPILNYSKFFIHKDNIFKLCQNFDVVIAYGDIAWLKLSTLTFHKKRKFRVIYWTIGVSASYDKKFDSISKWDFVRDYFYRRADGLIFYSDYPLSKYISRGFAKEKLFVAPNTVEVINDIEYEIIHKDSILFIGTLYMQKGILDLLENYKLAYSCNSQILPLNIIGGGKEYDKIDKWINDNELNNKISLLGPIFDSKKKSEYFKRAVACISPKQAGLSVLESMGYGIPYITMHDAITGGERLNIQNGINGILMNNISQLKNIILDISENEEKFIKMGENALKFYREKRKPEDMANALYSAALYVSNTHVQ
ncbi:MAG: glycosyltransferase [Bacteroidales bacterium]|nr:glycosyltransferase [Bacteroidales bacterium]